MEQINILLPAMDTSDFFRNSYYPKTLTEVRGKPMLQHVIENYDCLEKKHLIVILLESECLEFHTDKMIHVLNQDSITDIQLREHTAGALCTSLMAVKLIDNDTPLIIANSDQIINSDISRIVTKFQTQGADCGMICFKSVHPRWSYILADGEDVLEAAEKKPLSDKAIAGFYYFRQGRFFVEAAKNVLRKRACHKGKYYLSATINEIILQGMKVSYEMISAAKYHAFYSPDKIADYENAH